MTDFKQQHSDSFHNPHLGLWGCVSIIVGIVVGVSIFKVPALVFNNVEQPWHGLAAWVAGGLLSLVGALCYAELATAYPKMGGDYTYLSRAFHPFVGYLFGWSRLAVMQTASIGALSYVVADYALPMFPGLNIAPAWIAAAAVSIITVLNILGVHCGKTAQNILTLLKVAGIVGIIACGLWLGSPDAFSVSREVRGPGIGLAMILILYAYGGWSEAAFIAAEMRDHKRNIPRALILSLSAITVVYLIINIAYLMALGFDGVRQSAAPAADVLQSVLGETGMLAISCVVILSVLGALNGTILTGSRVYAAMGKDHRAFALTGRWSARFGTPVWSFTIQGLLAIAMILAVGTGAGRSGLDAMLNAIGLNGLPWERYGGGFETLVAGGAPVFWFFMLLTGVSTVILRVKDKDVHRPFKLIMHPLLPIILCLTCIYMLHSSCLFAGNLSLFAVFMVLIGAPWYFLRKQKSSI